MNLLCFYFMYSIKLFLPPSKLQYQWTSINKYKQKHKHIAFFMLYFRMIGDHGFLQLSFFFIAVINSFYCTSCCGLCSAISFTQWLLVLLLLLHLSVKFFKLSFLMVCPQNFRCFFLIFSSIILCPILLLS